MSAEGGAAVERVLAALRDHGSRVEERGGSWMAQCPAHDDATASLSLGQGNAGAVLHCQAGCDTLAGVLPALKLSARDLFDSPRGSRKALPYRVTAEYRYTDEHGELLYIKERREPKDFRVKRPDGRGGWIWHLSAGTRRVLYRLPEIVGAGRDGRTVYVVEGEKDADRLASLGYAATCNFDGAAKDGQRTKWRPEYGDILRDANVVIVADRDPAGIAHAKAAMSDLQAKAKSVVIMLPKVADEHADVSDHLDAGHTLDELKPLDAEAPQHPDSDGEDGDRRGPSQSAVLAHLAEDRYRLLSSDDGRPYAVEKDGPNVAMLLRGKGALRARLARIYADKTSGRVPSAAALTDALTVLEGRAASKDPETVFLRLAQRDGRVVIDLGTADGRCVIVGPDGWRREPRSPVLFRRTKLTSPIPDPLREAGGLDMLRKLLNTEEREFRLIVGWLVAALIPDIAHPILALRGEQGTAKSTAAQMLADIIDPSPAPLRTVPKDMKQWAVSASASWVVALDNVSQVPGWLSDTLCKAVTGDGYVDRVLYSDDDVTVLAFRRVIILTSIDPGALAGDLAERLLVIELQPILDTDRRAESEVREAFADSRRAIAAALYGLLGQVLAKLPGLTLDRLPRMADFARVLAAIDEIQKWTTLGDYLSASTDIAADVLEGNAFASAIIDLMNRRPREADGAGTWTGTATDLLKAVVTPEKPPKDWPKDATRAGGQLTRAAKALREIGIDVRQTKSTDRNRTRQYTITVTADWPGDRSENSASAASAASETPPDQHERADAVRAVSVRTEDASVRRHTLADAADTEADAGNQPASAGETASELHQYVQADAADAADAEIPKLSSDICGQCGEAHERYGRNGRPCRRSPARTSGTAAVKAAS
ncbi:MAG: hypothetical protein ACYCVZ_04685 [Streptosporangiaceae bacterium]